jgi:prepilin-type N-terminal cleavage/methylation domain-containing protein
MNRRAFTLMELLVVVGIILVLMGLLVPAVGMARRASQRAKTVATIGQVAAAIDGYRGVNAVYPERWVKPTDANDAGRKAVEAALAPYATPLAAFATMDGKDCYGVVFAASLTPPVTANPVTSVTSDAWLGVNAVLTNQLGSLVSDTAKAGLLVDAWGVPLRYRPSKWYPYSGSTPRIDSDEPPGQDSYQLWSAGVDKVDDADPGEGGDDVPQWAKK